MNGLLKKLLLSFIFVSFTSILAITIYSKFFQRPILNFYSQTNFRKVSDQDLDTSFDKNSNRNIAASINPSIVFIQVVKKTSSTLSRDSGSGVVLTPDGYIITCWHVVANGDEIFATLSDNNKYTAKLIGKDELTDLAVLKIEIENSPFVFIGNSNLAYPGDNIFAFANPYKLRNSLSFGVISAKYRNLNILGSNAIESFIQFDALADSGSSGGALIDENGKLIGLISAVNSGNSGNEHGFGFAIPSNIVKKVAFDLINFKTVNRVWLGLYIDNLEIPIDSQSPNNGIMVVRVEPNSPASSQGIRSGDKLISIDSLTILNQNFFQEIIAQKNPGDTIILKIQRKDQILQKSLILVNQYNSEKPIITLESNLGFNYRDLSEQEQKSLKTKGVLITGILKGSQAEKVNLEQEYIIKEINGIMINNSEELSNMIDKSANTIKLSGFYKDYPGTFSYVFVKNINRN